MTTAAIRKKLMTYIADAGDKKIKGLYMLVEDDIISEIREPGLSDEEVKVLDEDREMHVKGKSKSYKWSEAKEIIRSKKKM